MLVITITLYDQLEIAKNVDHGRRTGTTRIEQMNQFNRLEIAWDLKYLCEYPVVCLNDCFGDQY